MNFGYGPANDVKKRLLTLWNSYKFFVGYAEIEGFAPTYADLEDGPPTATALDRYLVARVNEAVARCREALDGYWTPTYVAQVESLVDDLSNWYIRGSRARFWRSGADDQDAAFRTLWYALVQVTRLIGPSMPFLAEELWQNLVTRHGAGAPDSVHLAGFPTSDESLYDAAALASMRDVQDVIRLGRKVRSEANHKLRQPLAEAIVSPRNAQGRASIEQHCAEIAAELNVKGVRVADRPEELVEVEVVPNFRALGPRLGKDMPTVKRLLSEGQYTRRDGVIEVGGHELGEGDYDTRSHAREGYEVADEGAFVVALDVRLTDELVDEGIARDLVHVLQAQRRDAGFEVTDRIRVAWAGNDRARRVLERHGEYVAAETLAVELAEAEPGDAATPFEAEGASLRVAVRRA